MKNSYIIKKHEEFNNIINNGKRIKGNILTLYYHPSIDEKKYFGFAVGKKNGNAVQRNFIKRRLRMLINTHQNLFSKKYKYIIMIRGESLDIPFNKWNDDLVQLIGKVK